MESSLQRGESCEELLQRNTTYLPISVDTPFTRDTLADDVGRYGEGEGAAELLRGTYNMDIKEMNSLMALSEMTSFLQAL